MGTTRFWTGAALTFAIGSINALGLTWENSIIAHQATPEETEFTACFTFSNDSDQTVIIESVRSTCGCTVPELVKRVYAPGESGSIDAVFSFGTRTGAQRKTISVLTDEQDSERQDLILEVDIPILIDVRPFFVFWRKQEALTTKTIEVRVSDPKLIVPVAVESQSENFQAEIQATDDPAVYQVAITPQSTEVTGNTHFLIKTNFPEENPKIVRVYAGIR